jgi:hypothetical protein
VLKHVLDVIELLDRPQAHGHSLAAHLHAVYDRARKEADAAASTPAAPGRPTPSPQAAASAPVDISVTRVEGAKGGTDFVKVVVPGSAGARAGGPAPTLGVLGRLGGVGARPERIGLVSDADGAVAALAAAAKLLDMHGRGDVLQGDVILSTHVCPDAPTRPHDPVPFMDSPVSVLDCNREEIDEAMEAVVSIDTTKGNRLLNHRGLAISPTVKEGWILRPSDDLLGLLETVTGEDARVLPITTQDITPYGNGVHHINSIMQPCVATSAPVVGLALTTRPAVAGCATGASHEGDIAAAGRFAVEAAKEYGRGAVRFHDPDEFARLVDRYGPMTHLQSTADVTDD